jgi:hypothetical protein
MAEFKKQRIRVKNKMALIKLMIYINFDLWTSSNFLRIVAVIIYFLDKNLINRSLLIGIRKMKSSHNKENINEAIIPIFVKMEVINKLNYFITDNVFTNDVIIKIVL